MSLLDLSQYCLVAATILVALASVAFIASQTTSRRTMVAAGAGGGSIDVPVTEGHGVGWYAVKFTQLAFVFMTLSALFRMVVVKHAPFSNQYEFACSFAWSRSGSD